MTGQGDIILFNEINDRVEYILHVVEIKLLFSSILMLIFTAADLN